MTAFDILCRIVSTFFGAGYVPKAPGTAGTLAALPLYLMIRKLSLPRYLLITAAVVVAGIVSSMRMESCWGKDPQKVVIDEVAGVLITMIAGPRGAREIFLGAMIFRLFDITKPPPVRQLEALPGGFGVMMDDVAAGALSAVVLAGILKLVRRLS
jgi:phosphatidylglycerophosphatase A